MRRDIALNIFAIAYIPLGMWLSISNDDLLLNIAYLVVYGAAVLTRRCSRCGHQLFRTTYGIWVPFVTRKCRNCGEHL